MNKAVKHLIVNPKTGKRTFTVCLQTDLAKTENFRWNTVFHVYNSNKDYHQLMTDEVKKLVW